MPYAAAAELLSDVLPIGSGDNATTVRQHVLRVAEHLEAELPEERASSIDGCPSEWAALPCPEGRIVVGLDGGYVRDWSERKRNFEIIVGRSLPEDRAARYLGLVHGYDGRRARRWSRRAMPISRSSNPLRACCRTRAWPGLWLTEFALIQTQPCATLPPGCRETARAYPA